MYIIIKGGLIMDKNKIQINELNKLYDEIYYSNLDNIEYALDVITNLISQKEYEDTASNISGLSNIIDAIIEIFEEVAEAFDNEELMDAYYYTKEKIDKLQSGDLDKTIEDEYEHFEEEIDDSYLDGDFNDDITELDEEVEDEDNDYFDY